MHVFAAARSSCRSVRSSHKPEERADLVHEHLRLLERGEVTTLVELVPVADVGVAPDSHSSACFSAASDASSVSVRSWNVASRWRVPVTLAARQVRSIRRIGSVAFT